MKTMAVSAGLVALLAAAACAAKGDETTMKTTVHREEDRVWLEGVNGWFCGDKESSVHAAQEAVMQAVGEDITYDDLLGISALAFRMQVHKEGLCPSSPHSFCGYMCVKRSTEALPWNVRVFEVKPDETEKVAEARKAVVDSIDRGVPVQYGSEEDGVIVGYRKKGAEWICLHTMRDQGEKTFIETRWPWGVAVFTGPKDKVPDRRDLDVGALKQAVAMAKANEANGYFVGFKAWDEYLARVRALDAMDDEERAKTQLGNAWIYECLAQYRAGAARYLRGVAGSFGPDAARHLRAAADLYDEMANRVLRDDDHCTTTIAPYPGPPSEGVSWTEAARRDQVRRLEQALPLERKAIDEIEKAIAAVDEPDPRS